MVKDKQGQTALHKAVVIPGIKLSMIQSLIKKGVRLTSADNQGQTAMDLAPDHVLNFMNQLSSDELD